MKIQIMSWFWKEIREGKIEVIPDGSEWEDVDTKEKFISPVRLCYNDTSIAGFITLESALEYAYYNLRT